MPTYKEVKIMRHQHGRREHGPQHGFDNPRRAFRRGFPPEPPFGPWPGPPGARGGFPGRPGRGGGRGRRGRRGDVRAAILALLTERPMHGYEMIQEIRERSGGLWRPSPGSVYPTLQLLADEGLITSGDGGGSKRLFELTDEGRAAAERQEGAPPWEQIAQDADPDDVNLQTAAGLLISAVHTVIHTAAQDQKTRAIDVINGARRELYAILGEVEPPVTTTHGEDDED
jgi:DNA-binding PadR family transcriptional regulator